jgi:hypothetical protein
MEDATPGKKDEVADRRAGRAFRPAPWLLPAAALMIAIALAWILFL